MPKKDIEWAVTQIKANKKTYQACQDYYDGNHPLLFATEKFKNTFGPLFREFADNICPIVVEAVPDRLTITGWRGDDADAAGALWEKWRPERLASQLHRTGSMKGDAYLMAWPDAAGDVKFWPHEPDGIAIQYDELDDPNRITRIGKVWKDSTTEKWRCTLYYDDHFEKYEAINKSDDLPDREYRWDQVGDVTNTYGRVPFFHFGNRAEIGELGVSELKGTIPIQDALNKSICDMLVAMEFVALPQRYATGLQIEVDEDTGKPKNTPFTPGVDRIWTAAGEVKFGQFDPATLEPFIKVQDSLRLEMARISGTPPYYVAMNDNLPSGESLKTIDGRLINKIEKSQEGYNDPWIAFMVLASEMDGKPLGDTADILPVWAAASPHNPLLDAEVQLVKGQVGVSQRQSLRELGYSDSDIDQMQQEALAEAKTAGEVAKLSAPPAPPSLLGPDGQPVRSQDPSGRPTAFNRNGSPGQQSKPGTNKESVRPRDRKSGGVKVPAPKNAKGPTTKA